MNELIKINKENDRITVLGRDLHKFLEITERYSSWFERMLQYGFVENIDYLGCKLFNTLANQELQNHQLTLDMAKEISMIQRNEKGKQARQYFIECEKQLNKPLCIEDMIIKSAQQLKEVRLKQLEYDKRLSIIEAKQINSPYEFYSVVAYCNLNNKKCELSDAIAWGKEAAKRSKQLGVKMGTTPDPRFGQVNTYHIDILNQIIKGDLHNEKLCRSKDHKS